MLISFYAADAFFGVLHLLNPFKSCNSSIKEFWGLLSGMSASLYFWICCSPCLESFHLRCPCGLLSHSNNISARPSSFSKFATHNLIFYLSFFVYFIFLEPIDMLCILFICIFIVFPLHLNACSTKVRIFVSFYFLTYDY